jgi:hypothetical protein
MQLNQCEGMNAYRFRMEGAYPLHVLDLCVKCQHETLPLQLADNFPINTLESPSSRQEYCKVWVQGSYIGSSTLTRFKFGFLLALSILHVSNEKPRTALYLYCYYYNHYMVRPDRTPFTMHTACVDSV